MEFFHWNIDPILLKLGPLELRYYSLMFAFGFILGFWIMRRVFKRDDRYIEDLDSLLVHLVLGTMIGARLGHVIFYEPGKYFSNPIEILKVWEGGLASHGGVIGVLTAVWLYCRKHTDQPFLWLLDRLAVPVALVSAMIRLGNFFNSEILGRPTDVAWAIVFERAPIKELTTVPLHPAMLYESFAYLVTFVVMCLLERKQDRQGRGFMTGAFMVLIFGARFVIEFFKLRQVKGADDWALSQGQWLSIPLVLFGALLMLRAWKNGHVPLPPIRYKRALFVCTGNSCRSVMAEHLFYDLSQGRWQAHSAGTEPTGKVHPLALKVLEEIGIDASRARSEPTKGYIGRQFHLVVTVCDDAKESCPTMPGIEEVQHWPFPDPANATGSEAEQLKVFRKVRDQIRKRLQEFLGEN